MSLPDFKPPIVHIGIYQDKSLCFLLPIRGMILINEDEKGLTLMDQARNEYVAKRKDVFGWKEVLIPIIHPKALTKIKNAPDAGTTEAD